MNIGEKLREVLSLQRLRGVTHLAEPLFYTCMTAECRQLGGVVVEMANTGLGEHEHWCPLEEDMCGSRVCNETGTCQG